MRRSHGMLGRSRFLLRKSSYGQSEDQQKSQITVHGFLCF
jgi:hypothetical protein